MRILSSPPLSRLEVARAEDGLLELRVAASERVKGGATAAAGGAFAAYAARFVRLPLPMPLRLVPAALLAAGAGIGALGALALVADHRVIIERGKGVRIHWRLPPLSAKELEIPVNEIARFEVTREQRGRRVGDGMDYGYTVFVLDLITTGGRSHGLEEHGTRDQAEARKAQLEETLGR